jgi:HSP20 family protein
VKIGGTMTTTLRKKTEEQMNPLETLQDQINRLFDMSYGRVSPLREELRHPLADVYEDKDNVFVEAELPGFEQKEIKLSINDDYLVIAASHEEQKEERKKNFYRNERVQGNIYREIYLPSSVDASKVNAVYRNGILKVTLPKKEETKGKEIKVNVE